MGNNIPKRRHRPPSSLRRIHAVGVIYCTSTASAQGREFEKLADSEVIEVAQAVCSALEHGGLQVDVIDLDPSAIADLRRYDWVFNLTETIYGYPLFDYEIARQMEDLGIHFTGSGSGALQACLDKAVTKAKLIRSGILTPVYDVFSSPDSLITNCRFPVIVKPLHEDGSFGISSDSVASDSAELAAQVERIHSLYQQAALVEEYIDGRDITASVLGTGENARVLPLSEIIYPQQNELKVRTFAAKWEVDSKDYQGVYSTCPCDLEPETARLIEAIALRTCKLMNCRDYTRVDFRLKGSTPYVLEVNPNPCINPHDSGFVRAATATGYSYDELVQQILASSLRGMKLERQFPHQQPGDDDKGDRR